MKDEISMIKNDDFRILLNEEVIKNNSIEELEIQSKFNSNNNLLLILVIKPEEFKNYERKIVENITNIKIIKGENIIFEGILKSLITYNNIINYYLRLEASDNSIKLNNNEHYFRIYQDENISYSVIINDVLKDKKLQYYISKDFDKKINGVIYQYEENDWNFLKRISSHINMPIFITQEGVIQFGYDNINTEIDLV